MEKRLEDDRILEKVDEKKRDFLKKVVIGTAFAVPVINSFSMEGLKIDLTGRMAKADEFDKPGVGYDAGVKPSDKKPKPVPSSGGKKS